MSKTPLEIALRRLDDWQRLERLTADLLEREEYEVDPTGTKGPDGGRDSLLFRDEEQGILHCSIQRDWEAKLKDDAEKANKYSKNLDFFFFSTIGNPSAKKRDRVEEELREKYDWRVEILDFERLRNKLMGDSSNHDIAEHHLNVDPGRAYRDVPEYVLENLREQYAGIKDITSRIESARQVEDLLGDVIRKTVPDVGIRKTQFFASTAEYDYILTNSSTRYPWRGMGPFVLAECKWQKTQLQMSTLRNIEAKAQQLHPECSGAIVLTQEGITDQGRQLVHAAFQQGKYLIVLDEDDLTKILEHGRTDEVLEQCADRQWL